MLRFYYSISGSVSVGFQRKPCFRFLHASSPAGDNWRPRRSARYTAGEQRWSLCARIRWRGVVCSDDHRSQIQALSFDGDDKENTVDAKINFMVWEAAVNLAPHSRRPLHLQATPHRRRACGTNWTPPSPAMLYRRCLSLTTPHRNRSS